MPSYEPPPLIAPSLRALRDYMHVFYPERARTAPIPLDFWSESDDEIFLDMLGYLPLHLTDDALARLDELPEAFRIAYPVFRLEDDYEVNGWTALLNAGEDLLPSAVAAYERAGMTSEAQALAAALESIRANPGDEHAAERAYKSVPNRYSDDDTRLRELLRFFRGNAGLWVGRSDA